MLFVPQRYLFRAAGLVPSRVRHRLMRFAGTTAAMSAGCHIVHDGLVLQVRAHYRRWFSIPGGLMRRGEQPAAAAVREVREETGLDVEVFGEPAIFYDPNGRRTEFIYNARLILGQSPDQAHVASPEIAEVRWVTEAFATAEGEDPHGFNQTFMTCLAEGGGLRVLEASARD